ncbi:MAG: hypothetical protein Tsb009_28190 [Planctomycetaceae bacterium]
MNRLEAAPLHDFIDKTIDQRAGGSTAPLADDAEFLRRIYLDLVGTIPTSAEARKFLADKSLNKRETLIDRLLADARFPRRMREAFTVMLLERRAGSVVPNEKWNAWLETAFAKNKPWNQLVAEILSADGLQENSAAGIRFFVDGGRNNPDQMTRDIGRLFLGMDLQCAQCHDHPNVKSYKQVDYVGLLAFVKTSKLQNRKYFLASPKTEKIEFQSVFTPLDKKTTGPRLPGGKEIAIPTFKKGEEFSVKGDRKKGTPSIPKFRPRVLLAKELTRASNRRFVLNSVNRIWFLMMGRGLVHPLDFLHNDNPASHPKLLNQLADEFVKHKFDLRWLIREIALSKTYQRSSRIPENIDPKTLKPEHYRVAIAKPLAAEQMAWTLMRATGMQESIQKNTTPPKQKFTVKDYINGRIPTPKRIVDVMTLFSGMFGNPPGEAEVEFQPSSSHSLFLMNDKLMVEWLKPQAGNLVSRLMRINKPEQLADELYLSVLTRFPTSDERKRVVEHLTQNKNRRTEAIADYTWALLASSEFRLNH